MIILIRASANGKTEIAKKLISHYNFQKAVTYTTRPPRVGEVNDVDYHFVSIDKFKKLMESNFFLETTLYNQNYYGTSKDELSENKVLIIDPKGLNAYKKLGISSIVTFFILGNEDIRKSRMEKRGDSQEDIKKRIENDKIDFAFSSIGTTDFVIDGNELSITELAEEINKKYYQTLASKTK